jgi:DNA-binding XRE family transcriptional regulator
MSEEKNKGGRPPVVLTDEQIIELKALSAVLNKEQLADYFGVSHVTLLAIEERQPEVSLAYKNGKAKAIASIGGNLISQAKSGNTAAAIFYLKTQAGWKEQQVVDHQSSDKSMSPSFANLYGTKPNGES